MARPKKDGFNTLEQKAQRRKERYLKEI